MSKMTWTAAQQAALDARGQNLLLAASAGSGKTAVLTARIKELLTDTENPLDISEILVLTFTRAAAGEMKTRIASHISKALLQAREENDAALTHHLSRQLSLLSGAQISTLDSFFQSLIRQYFYLIDLDPDTQILSDANEIDLLKQDVLNEVLEAYYTENNPHFLDCADLLSRGFNDTGLRDTILYLYNFSCSMAFPEDWLTKLPMPYRISEKSSLSSIAWADSILSEYQLIANGFEDSYRQIFSLLEKEPDLEDYLPVLSEEYDAFSFLAHSGHWQDWYASIPKISFERLKSKSKSKASDPIRYEEIKNRIQDIRNSVKDKFKKKIFPFFSIPEQQWIDNVRDMYPVAEMISRITVDFLHAYHDRKKQDGLMEFSDMEHYALDILLDKENPRFSIEKADRFPSEAARMIQKKYKEIMIDEYQDTNGVQELITSLISGGYNRFMVGDIKQSIYAFRQADPTIFLDKYTVFTDEEDAGNRRIDLNQNFRSDPTILSSINYIFRQLMDKKQLGLAYGERESLHPGRYEEPRPGSYIGGSVTLDWIDKSKSGGEEDTAPSTPSNANDIDTITLEGRLIARRIQSFFSENKKVMNSDGTFRNIDYKDIVVLLRATNGKAPALLKVLNEAGIPAVSDKEDDFLQTSEVRVLWSLLQILDNPLQNLPLTAVLRSFFVGLDEKDLTALHNDKKADEDSLWEILLRQNVLPAAKSQRLSHFLNLYKKWRDQSVSNGIAPLLRAIFEDTDYITWISGLPGGDFRKSHIQAFYNLALQRDSSVSNGLFSFLEYLRKSKKEFKTVSSAKDNHAVRIMSVHKSKGLEFPVVFLADTAKTFNTVDLKKVVIADKSMGIGIHYFDKAHHARWPTLYQIALKAKVLKETQAEEARLLYVAMTRARDKLYILASENDFLKNLQARLMPLTADNVTKMHTLPGHLVGNANSYLSWILPAVAGHRSMLSLWKHTALLPRTVEDAPSDRDTQFDWTITSRYDLLTAEEKAIGKTAVSPKNTIPLKKENAADIFLSFPESSVPAWLGDQLRWTYDFPGAVDTPAKLTATTATQQNEDREMQSADETTPPSAILAPDIEDTTTLPGGYETPPDFLSETPVLSGTSYGTLMHKTMELLDLIHLPPVETAIRQEIESLYERNALTAEEKGILLHHSGAKSPVRDILKFMHSPLQEAMKKADIIRKELPFSVLLPASRYYPDCEKGEDIFLQGVIDCLLETDGQLTIIDYKTDRIQSADELKKHYTAQLLIYKEAAEQILKKPVTGLYLWSFHLEKMIPVDAQ